MTFYLGIAALICAIIVFPILAVGARYDDTLNNTTDERREINAAIGLGAAADFLHDGSATK